MQIFSAGNLQLLASDQWTRSLPLSAERGQILDANGMMLATSYTSYDVYVRASNVTNPDKVARLLSDRLELNYEDMYNKATNKGISESLIKMQVDKETALEIKNEGVAGIYLSDTSKRYYPYGDLATQILGYTTIDNIGQSGIELYYDKYLKGIDGYASVQSDIRGIELYNMLDSYTPSISGVDIQLTLDYRIQQITENALDAVMEVEKPKSATAIVMDPNTGEILAMSSKPSFDLNEPPREDISYLNACSKNLGIVDVYEPGSTFKVLTTAVALQEGKARLEDTFYDPGYRIVDGEKIKCWKSVGHGHQTLVDGLNNSCNSVFVDLALRIGTDTFYDYFNKFGFGSQLGIDFPGESGGILMEEELVKKVDLARMGFGQAIAVTPLQQITAVSSVLNGGILMQPTFLKGVYSKNGDLIKQNTAIEKNRVISSETSETIRYMLEDVVNNSYGKNTFIPGYRISGKTGTSQKYVETGISGSLYTSSFVGAFPADKPEYVVLVVVDEPSSGAFFGSIVATPYAKMIFQGIIDYKNIAPENLEEDLTKIEEKIEMPNLVGLSLTEAAGRLAELGLLYELDGDGGVVLQQTPPPGTKVYEGAIILLKT